jgi:biopolymer transport protein TolQ
VFLEVYHEGSTDAAYEAARELRRSPLARIFLAAYRERTRITKYAHAAANDPLDADQRHRLGKHILWVAQEEARRLESRLTFLATTGSATPFIGLFGTVIGIINAFGDIGEAGSASLAVVAPGIAEALIATALGLFAAIPATIFYNGFVGRLRGIHGAIEIYANELEGDLARPLGFGNASQAARG